MPKQFLRLGGDNSLLQETHQRYAPLIPAHQILIVAGQHYSGLIRQQLPEIPPENLLIEPSPRDTAPAVGLAALEARRRDPSSVLVVSPSDHRVREPAAFRESLKKAILRAVSGGLGTLGIRPDHPATSFGYLKVFPSTDPSDVRRVERFVEKPDARTARRYFESGDYLWNAGVFVFRVDVFFESLSRVYPEMARGLEALARAEKAATIARLWDGLPCTSIDYALMEKTADVWTVPLDAGWDDVGSWPSAEKSLDRDERGNALTGREALFVETSRSTVFSEGSPPGRMTVLVGVEDLIIVNTEDVVLVCGRERADEVKKAVDELLRRGRVDLL